MNKVNVIKQNLEFIGKTWMKCIGTFASILSLFFLFWTWDDIRITSTQYKCVIIILLCVLALILAILWTCIFKRTKTIWESPSGKIKVCYSDIMKDGFDKRNKEEKLFVIPVNSCFDTIVDEDISTCSKPLVSPNSLHGRWIKTMVNKGFTIEEIDNKIHNCLEMQNLVPKSIIADEDKERGKREVYELGTVAMIRGNNNSTFLLLAISEYDKDNIAHTSVDDLEMCIKSLLNFYDQHGQGHRLVIPLMGTNLSRAGLSHNDSLRVITSLFQLYAIYIFVDEFSDLTDDEQEKFSTLLKKLLGSKNNVFFKVGTITDRFYFGKDIIIGRDIYPIYLDLSDFVERYGGIVAASKELIIYTEELIQKRLNSLANGLKMNDVFKGNKNEILLRISREAMGVPRTIGLILQNALTQVEVRNEKFIQISDINVGVRETRKIYFKQFQGAVQKKVIPGFYMDMWNSLLKRALDEKAKNSNRPASHFMIDPIRKKYLNIFCENFMVHCLEDSRASKYGGNYVLYAIDYDICNDNSIIYADQKDEFTAIRFIYDSVFQAYDCYFLKDRIKSYKCPICNRIYDEMEVAQAKVKRCFECDEKLEEIIHKDVPISDGNYTEVEVKILGIIATLSKEEAMSAAEIGDAVGCSYQKVANWCSKVLAKKELINIEKREGRNYYYDKMV